MKIETLAMDVFIGSAIWLSFTATPTPSLQNTRDNPGEDRLKIQAFALLFRGSGHASDS